PDGVRRDGLAVSTDNGLSWTVKTVPLSKSNRNGGDPSVSAGSGGALYYGFVNFDGHAKIAVSHDRGTTWSKPADVGTPYGIRNGGGSNQCRNLLDFNDITVDRIGRVLVGYADGCTGACLTDPNQNTFDALATIARQASGKGLFSAFDGSLPK